MTRIQKKALILFCGTFLSFGLINGTIPTIIPQLTGNTGVSIGAFGLLFSFRSFAFIVANILLPNVFEKMPGNRFIAIALCYFVLFALIFPYLRSFPVFMVMVLGIGTVTAITEAGSNSSMRRIMGEFAPSALNLMYASSSIGFILSPLFMSYALSHGYDWRLMILLLSLPVIPVIILALNVPFEKGSVQTLSTPLDKKSKPREEIRSVLFIAGIFLICAIGAEAGFNSWLPTVASQAGILPESTAALLATAMWSGSLISRLLTAAFIRKVSPSAILIMGVSLLILCPFLLLLSDAPETIFVTAFLAGISTGPLFSCLSAYLSEKYQLNGKDFGKLLAAIGFGCLFFPWLTGVGFEKGGINLYAILLIIPALIAAISVGFIFFKKSAKISRKNQ